MTSISTYVQATADIVRVVSLKPGDVYKRLSDTDYGSPKMHYGIVTSVLNNGTKTAVTAVEYEAGYGTVAATAKVFTDRTEVALFPATPEEVSVHVRDLFDSAERGVQTAERELHNKREALAHAVRAVEMFEAKTLTAPETAEEMTS